MSEILDTLGLVGVPKAVEVSNDELFSASDETGAWIVTAHRPFASTEWMKVTIDGIRYDITVTDAILPIFTYINDIEDVRYYDPLHHKDNKTANCVEVTSNTKFLYSKAAMNNVFASDDPDDGWYVVPAGSSVVIDHVLWVAGDTDKTVNLILCEGASLTVNNGVHVLDIQSPLVIWGEKEAGKGKLTATSQAEEQAGIGGGGTTGSVSGGEGGSVSINGGKVTATAGTDAAAIGAGKGNGRNGSLTLYRSAKVHYTKDGSGYDAETTPTDGREAACRNGYAEIKPCDHAGTYYEVDSLTQHKKKCKNCMEQDLLEDHVFTDGKCVCGLYQVAYVNADGSDAGTKLCERVTCDMSGTGVTGGWYAVTQHDKLTDRITVSGDVNLILCDSKILMVEKGITVNSGNSLTIWGQHRATAKDDNDLGQLWAGTSNGRELDDPIRTCKDSCAGIGGDG